jgi:hypothetical protein
MHVQTAVKKDKGLAVQLLSRLHKLEKHCGMHNAAI